MHGPRSAGRHSMNYSMHSVNIRHNPISRDNQSQITSKLESILQACKIERMLTGSYKPKTDPPSTEAEVLHSNSLRQKRKHQCRELSVVGLADSQRPLGDWMMLPVVICATAWTSFLECFR